MHAKKARNSLGILHSCCALLMSQHFVSSSANRSQKQKASLTVSTDWPWIAAIYHLSYDMFTFKCTGALIHSSIIMTPATCVFEDGQKVVPRRIRIELGKSNNGGDGDNVQIVQVVLVVSFVQLNVFE